jgi:hypothetical protein
MLFNDKQVFEEIQKLHAKIEIQQSTIDALMKLVKAKYGLKVDGTPKAKPGRKLGYKVAA